jgi:hypothetical protein
MTISPDEAGKMLADVESVVARLKQSRIYRTSSDLLIMWGGIVAAGNLFSAMAPRLSGWGWIGLSLIGAAVTIFALRRRGTPGTRFPTRVLAGFALFFAFGWVWSEMIGHFGPRQLAAFWPTVFLFGYALAGLAFGAAFGVIGIGLAALIVMGYFWSGEWFPVYLALVHGGGLMLGGYWMRRA